NVRPLFGQSPYIVNTILTYTNDSIGFNTALSFNVQGEKLILVTKGGLPDIYQQPMPTLDFSINKIFKQRFQIGFRIQNILAPDNRKIYTYKDVEYDWNTYNIGRTFSFSLGYRIN
ncbi:MAG: TonB-dependent receptor, partial [Flavobacteriales bacterium]|nr:TonB-dependent receptor [Flavobacteriales bacterium]